MSIERMYLRIMKAIYDKSTTNFIHCGEKLKVLSPRSETRQGCPLLSLLFGIVLEVLARTIRQEKEIKGIQIAQEETKLSLFVDGVIVYIENPRISHCGTMGSVASLQCQDAGLIPGPVQGLKYPVLPQLQHRLQLWLRSLVWEFCKKKNKKKKTKTKKTVRNNKQIFEFSGYKINIQKSVAFLYTNKKLSEREIKKTIPFIIASKRIKYLGISLTKGVKDLYTENYKTLFKKFKKTQ